MLVGQLRTSGAIRGNAARGHRPRVRCSADSSRPARVCRARRARPHRPGRGGSRCARPVQRRLTARQPGGLRARRAPPGGEGGAGPRGRPEPARRPGGARDRLGALGPAPPGRQQCLQPVQHQGESRLSGGIVTLPALEYEGGIAVERQSAFRAYRSFARASRTTSPWSGAAPATPRPWPTPGTLGRTCASFRPRGTRPIRLRRQGDPDLGGRPGGERHARGALVAPVPLACHRARAM